MVRMSLIGFLFIFAGLTSCRVENGGGSFTSEDGTPAGFRGLRFALDLVAQTEAGSAVITGFSVTCMERVAGGGSYSETRSVADIQANKVCASAAASEPPPGEGSGNTAIPPADDGVFSLTLTYPTKLKIDTKDYAELEQAGQSQDGIKYCSLSVSGTADLWVTKVQRAPVAMERAGIHLRVMVAAGRNAGVIPADCPVSIDGYYYLYNEHVDMTDADLLNKLGQ